MLVVRGAGTGVQKIVRFWPIVAVKWQVSIAEQPLHHRGSEGFGGVRKLYKHYITCTLKTFSPPRLSVVASDSWVFAQWSSLGKSPKILSD